MKNFLSAGAHRLFSRPPRLWLLRMFKLFRERKEKEKRKMWSCGYAEHDLQGRMLRNRNYLACCERDGARGGRGIQRQPRRKRGLVAQQRGKPRGRG